MDSVDACPSRNGDRTFLLEEKREMALEPASSAPTVGSQAQITLVREGLVSQEIEDRPGKPCLPGQSSLFTPAYNSLIITGESAKVIMKVKALGPSPAEGRDPRPQTFVLTPAAARWAAPGQAGEVARLLPTAMDLGQILHGPKPVLLSKANSSGGQASTLGEEMLIRVKDRPPQIGPQAAWRMASVPTRPQLPPGGVHNGSLGDMSLSCSSKGVYENFRRWQQYKTLARRHFPNTPDAEAVSCFLIPVLRSLARLKPDMRIEEGVPRAVQEWQRISNFDRMVFYEMAEKFMEFEEEEELQLQKVQLSSQYQHPPVLPSALRLPDAKRESPATAEVARQQVYFPKKATAKAPQPKRRQRRPAARAVAQMVAKEVPPEAVAQYIEIMDGLKPKIAEDIENAQEKEEEEEPASDQELLSYIHRLCDIDAFVSKVEAIIHPGFLAELLSPEKERDPLSLTDELEEEENLTVDELVQKRLLCSSEGDTPQDCCCGGPQFTSTPYQSDEEDDDSKVYTSRSPGFSGSQRSSTSYGMKRSSLSSEDSSRLLEAKLSPRIPQTQGGNFIIKRQPQPGMGTLALESNLLQHKSHSGSLDSSASDGRGQSEGREAQCSQGTLFFPKTCAIVPTMQMASMEKGRRSGSISKTEALETKIVQHWQDSPMQSTLLSPLVSNDEKSREGDMGIDKKSLEGIINTLKSAVPGSKGRSKEILVGNLSAEDLSCSGDHEVIQGSQSRISESRLHSLSSSTIAQLRDYNQEISSQQLAHILSEKGLESLISPPDQDGSLQLQDRHLPNQIHQPKLQASHPQLNNIQSQPQDNHFQSQNNHIQSQSSSLQNHAKHLQPLAHPPQHMFNLSISGAPDLTHEVREKSQLAPSGYSLSVLVDSKSSLVASLTKCGPGNGIQPVGNEIRMTFTTPVEHNALGESKQQQQQQLEANGSMSEVTYFTGRSISKLPVEKGNQQQLESKYDSKLDIAHTMTGSLTYCGVSKRNECHGNSTDSQVAVAHPLVSSSIPLSGHDRSQEWPTTQCNSKPHLICARYTPIDSSGQQESCNPMAERDGVIDLQSQETAPSQCITAKGRQCQETYTSTVLEDKEPSVKYGSEAGSHHYQLNFTKPVVHLASPFSLSTESIRENEMLQEGKQNSEDYVCSLNSPIKSSTEQYEAQNHEAYMTLTCPVALESVVTQEENPHLEVGTLHFEWACRAPEAICHTTPDSCQQRLKQEEDQGPEIRMNRECASVTPPTQDGDQRGPQLPLAPNAKVFMGLTSVLAPPPTACVSQEQNLQESDNLNSHSEYIHQLTESSPACNSNTRFQDHQALILDPNMDLQSISTSKSLGCFKEDKKQSFPTRNSQPKPDSPCSITSTPPTNSNQKGPEDHSSEELSPKGTSKNPKEELFSNTVNSRPSSTNMFDEGIKQEGWHKETTVTPLCTTVLEKNNSPPYTFHTNSLESKTVALSEGTGNAILEIIDSEMEVMCSMTLPPRQCNNSSRSVKLNETCSPRTSCSTLQEASGSLHSTVSFKPDQDDGGDHENGDDIYTSGLLHHNTTQEGSEQENNILDSSLAQDPEEENLEPPASEEEMKLSHQPKKQPQTRTSTINQSQKTGEKNIILMKKENLDSADDISARNGWVQQEQLTFQEGGFKSEISEDEQPPDDQENLLQNSGRHHLPDIDSASTFKQQCCHPIETRRDIQTSSASHSYCQSSSLFLDDEAEARPRSVECTAEGDDKVPTVPQSDCDQTQRGKNKRKSSQANLDHGEGGSVAKMMMLKTGQEGSLTIASLATEEKLQKDPTDHSWDFSILTLTRHPKRDLSNRVLRRSKRLNSN